MASQNSQNSDATNLLLRKLSPKALSFLGLMGSEDTNQTTSNNSNNNSNNNSTNLMIKTLAMCYGNVDQLMANTFQKLLGTSQSTMAKFSKFLPFTDKSANSEKTTQQQECVMHQDALSVVVIDVDYWLYYSSLSKYVLNGNNSSGSIDNSAQFTIPYHGMLALGIKFGNYIMRWTEFGIVDMIDLSQIDPSILRASIVSRNVTPRSQPTMLKVNASNLKKIATVIVQYNTHYQYDLYDKSPIQFIRNVCTALGVSFKLGSCCLLLKEMETHWKKYHGYEKIGRLENPYIEKDQLITSASHVHFLEMVTNLLRYNNSYSCDFPFEWSIMKSLDRTFKVCSSVSLMDPTLRNHYVSRDDNPFVSLEKTFGKSMSNFQLDKSDYTSSSSSTPSLPDTDETICVLALDGGGTRGIILAIILAELEKRTGRKLKDMFHLVCGTSTGALCARSIQAGFDAETILSLYLEFATKIFSSKQLLNEAVTKFYKVVSSGFFYEASKLESLILNQVGRPTFDGNDILTLNDLHVTSPKAFFVSTLVPKSSMHEKDDCKEATETVSKSSSLANNGRSMSTDSLYSAVATEDNALSCMESTTEIPSRATTDEAISYIFRTYPCPFQKDNHPARYKGTWNGKNVTVASALRASTAAPVYFEKKKIGSCHFIDGGVSNNNPTELAVSEMKKLFPNHKNFCIVSLGTGKITKTNTNKGGWFSFSSSSSNNSKSENTELISSNVNTLLDIFELSMSSEAIHRRVMDIVSETTDKNITYFRFNPTLDQDIPLDTTATEAFELMTNKTREYVRSEDAFNNLVKFMKSKQ
ncbi:hypothetical protein C9374_005330 [Naegleria lovaniensis]|uniref:PNPLA domain-containing protein n=1 Tax=Naegleria lovaniensis TaxID=51637 RepID=A0AA88GM31_NAELO|nr:uncharacterized protein C9374_005330 [Naegleria lovaniensis]KAG2382750.1 hypothetical protein C9374_005330 [Naegleria lovaniensis]